MHLTSCSTRAHRSIACEWRQSVQREDQISKQRGIQNTRPIPVHQPTYLFWQCRPRIKTRLIDLGLNLTTPTHRWDARQSWRLSPRLFEVSETPAEKVSEGPEFRTTVATMKSSVQPPTSETRGELRSSAFSKLRSFHLNLPLAATQTNNATVCSPTTSKRVGPTSMARCRSYVAERVSL